MVLSPTENPILSQYTEDLLGLVKDVVRSFSCIEIRSLINRMFESRNLTRRSYDQRQIGPWSHSSQFYYPIGNSVGFNILGNYSEEKGDVKILLGASGDIRNLLATVSEVSDKINSIAVTMNDENATMLARNLVLLCSF